MDVFIAGYHLKIAGNWIYTISIWGRYIRQLPEQAESLQESDVYECDKCPGRFASSFMHTEYRNFSYWDGGVDIYELCDACSMGL